MEFQEYRDFLSDTVKKILAVDSPSGFTRAITDRTAEIAEQMSYPPPRRSNQGNLTFTVDGRNNDITVALSAHLDTLGLMVRSIQEDGGLTITPIGAPLLPSLEGEYCRIYTRDGRIHTGTILSMSPSIHVFSDASTRPRDEKSLYVRIDAGVSSRDEAMALGIRPGDFVCYDPKTVITPEGFLKSRFIDDKGGAALLLTAMKILKDRGWTPAFRTEFCFTVYEEVGHGASNFQTVLQELLVVDMGCVGDDLTCTEQTVSICAKDSSGPYDYDMTSRLIHLAEKNGINFAVDIYPHYSSDASSLWKAGSDTRAALIGPGVQASHGMERTHLDGLLNTLQLIICYLDCR